ncbi:MAG: GNAT family N-acetyltransferase, partial [Oscillospiraceae bacterium]|nr:GNAT family N-acetyltransferase [Oscillospiraceae bacterium]
AELWVIPEERGKGYAQRLIKELLRFLPYRGAEKICAAVNGDVAAALGRLGFADGGSLKVMNMPVPCGRKE